MVNNLILYKFRDNEFCALWTKKALIISHITPPTTHFKSRPSPLPSLTPPHTTQAHSPNNCLCLSRLLYTYSEIGHQKPCLGRGLSSVLKYSLSCLTYSGSCSLSTTARCCRLGVCIDESASVSRVLIVSKLGT